MDTTGNEISRDIMEKILEEIAGYSIDIEEDPTQIHLGIPYLQKTLARCRAYTNRVTFYMQKVKRYENGLRSQLRTIELDLEFKMNEKLADDAMVRKQPSIEDRKALAATMLKDEHQVIAELKVLLQDVEENFKIIKAKHIELQRTSNDIKTQRNLVKDDMLARLGGHDGYTKPQTAQDRSVPEGLPAPVQAPIDPKDLLDDSKRPEDMPKPVDAEHAAMIADFMSRNPIRTLKSTNPSDSMDEGEPAPRKRVDFEPIPNGTKCSICLKPQMKTASGLICENGHGGVDPAAESENSKTISISYEDLL